MAAFPVPRSPNPACSFPAPGSPVGACTSHTGGAGRRQRGGWPLKGRPQRAARLPALLPRRPRRPSSLLTPRWTGSRNRPSLQHVMRPDSSTLAGVIGKATPGAHRLSTSLSTWGPFPQPALPGVSGTTDPSATPTAQSAPRGGLVDACTSPTGVPVLLRLPSCRHAGANTPAGTARCIVRLPSRAAIGLPLLPGGSAPALPVSRPAQRSQKFRPACSLSCSTQPFDTGVLQYMSLPPCTAPVATNRNENCCVGFAPTRKTRLSTAHR